MYDVNFLSLVSRVRILDINNNEKAEITKKPTLFASIREFRSQGKLPPPRLEGQANTENHSSSNWKSMPISRSLLLEPEQDKTDTVTDGFLEVISLTVKNSPQF